MQNIGMTATLCGPFGVQDRAIAVGKLPASLRHVRAGLEASSVGVGEAVEVNKALFELLREEVDTAQKKRNVEALGRELQDVAVQARSLLVLLRVLVALCERNVAIDAGRVQGREAFEIAHSPVVVVSRLQDVAQEVQSLDVLWIHGENSLEELLGVGEPLALALHPGKGEQRFDVTSVLHVRLIVPLVGAVEVLHLRVREAYVVEDLDAARLARQRYLELPNRLCVLVLPKQLDALRVRPGRLPDGRAGVGVHADRGPSVLPMRPARNRRLNLQ
mmetsp:Transcript_89105/g.250887  ORF Transcript_89105/g.250887 Transcript_89105/m.250887 type:complete len:275 (+) Transcript_89105:1272-2096(+)